MLPQDTVLLRTEPSASRAEAKQSRTQCAAEGSPGPADPPGELRKVREHQRGSHPMPRRNTQQNLPELLPKLRRNAGKGTGMLRPLGLEESEGTALRIVAKRVLQMILPFTMGRKSQMFIIRNGF